MGLFPKERDLTRAVEHVELRVDASFFRARVEDFVVRLDHFLGAHLTWRSRSSIQDLVRDGYVSVDASTPDHPAGTGRPALETRPGRRLRHGSRVIVVIPEELRQFVPSGPLPPLRILYEDRALLAVDKPAHLAVHPTGRHAGDTLIQRVHAHCAESIEAVGEAPRLAHRLDLESSGIVVVGKSTRAHRELRMQFEAGTVDKTYLALVWGGLAEDEGSIRLPLGPSRASRIRLKMAVREDGLAARTDWRTIARFEGYTLLECRLFTGRQHQIRVHLAALGVPIVGDKLYGPDDGLFLRGADGCLDEADRRVLELDRHALHHHQVGITTPDGDRRILVTSPLAPDLTHFIEGLRPA